MSECQNTECADHVQELLEENQHLRKLLYLYISRIEADYPCEPPEQNISIGCLDLSVRAKTCLWRANIKTLGQLDEFMGNGSYRTHRRSKHAIRNFGERSFFHTKNAIREYKEKSND